MELESKLSTLYDHYKESVGYLKADIAKRSKNTLLLIILFTAFFVFQITPTFSTYTINNILTNKAGFSVNLDFNVLFTILLILLFGSVISYFQKCINIEKQYSYIHQLEDKLNSLFQEELVTREGYNYLADYPLLNAFICRIYNYILPSLIVISMIVKSIFILRSKISTIFIVIDLFIMFFISLTCYLYILFVLRDSSRATKFNNFTKKIFVLLHLYKED